MRFFITGISKGFGYELALHFIKKGHSVFGFSRTELSNNEIFYKAIKENKLIHYIGDINSKAQTEQAIKLAIENFWGIDVLINNAALKLFKPLDTIQIDDFSKVIETNLISQIHISLLIIEEMKKNKSGHIINISSRAGMEFYEEGAAYCTSKSGLIAFTKSIATYLKKYNIRINVLSPPTFTTLSYKLNKPDIDHTKLLSSEKIIKVIDKLIFSKKFITGRNIPFYSYKSLIKTYLLNQIDFIKYLSEIKYR